VFKKTNHLTFLSEVTVKVKVVLLRWAQ